MRFPLRFRLAAMTLLAIPCCARSGRPWADDASLQALLQKGVARGYPGMAMMVETANGKIRAGAAGSSDLEHRTLMRVDDGFQIASINKTLTAVAVLRLVDSGKLSLQTTLQAALGEAASRIPYAGQITVAQLLDHSSGIYPTNNDADYLTTVIGPKADPLRVWQPAQLVALADRDRQKPTDTPGAGHHYSDTNYILLGMIVEKVSGTPYKRHVTETLLEPLGMRSTTFYSDALQPGFHPPAKARAVQGYLLATDELRSAISIHPMFQAVPGDTRKGGQLLNTTLAAEREDAVAGIVSNLPDMMTFAEALFRGKLLSAESEKFLMAAGEGMASRPIGEKRIWTLQSTRKTYGVLVYKEGDGPGGVNTLMAYLPARNEIFIGFTNIFGYFDEVDFMMDEVIGPLAAGR